jgi:hypothetical protein
LIRFEIHYGVAGGKFGGVELTDMPFTFWFFISMQAFLGSFILVNAIKELWNLLHRKTNSNDPGKNSRYRWVEAIYWLLATLFLVIVNLLAICSVVEMVFSMYGLIKYDEMPRKVILGSLFLLCIVVICYLYYTFLFRSLMDTFFPKARKSYFFLRKKMK